MADFYDTNTGEYVTTHEEVFMRRKVFYIHGTISDPERWTKWSEAVDVLNKIALPNPQPPEGVDTGFDWKKEATQFNSLKERWPVSDRLVEYVKDKVLTNNYSEVVLVGHSHGGNVAIMAADKLAEYSAISTIYVITIGTPVFNKLEFTTKSLIAGLKQAAETKITYKNNGMSAPFGRTSTVYTYTYYNPENPANWKNKHKIKHLSIYNEYDRVDGIAQVGDILLENSRMTSDTCSFQYDPTVNKKLVSKLTTNEENRNKYCHYLLYQIAILIRLRTLIQHVEISFSEEIEQRSIDITQDNTRIVKCYKTFKVLGYREITAKLPPFRELSLNQFVSGDIHKDEIHNVNSLALSEMRFLFANDSLFIDFVSKFSEEAKQKLRKEYPYGGGSIDFRSSNLKKIDEQITKLTRELERIKKFNARTDEDKFQNSSWWARFLFYGSKYASCHYAVRYLFEGIDNHGFDTNSPELIQQAINEGQIKPFEWVKQTFVEKTNINRKKDD